jgi:SAM-dependent methyltransferase
MDAMPSASEQFLRDFHNANPGATARAYAPLTALRAGRSYASTYDSLAEVVAPCTGLATVLDVGCGDGFLLSRLLGRPGLRLIGVDMSEGELAAAQVRLGSSAALCHANARSLPLAAASVDHALCHMALMLMEQTDLVIAEVRRVLKSGARFSAVVSATAPRSAALAAYIDLLAAFPRRAQYQALRFGDRRLSTSQGIEDVLGAAFTDIVTDDIVLELRSTPAQLAEWFDSMYDVHLLSPEDGREVQRRFTNAVARLRGADGLVDHSQTLRQFSAAAA